jgi:hypothetical protein
MLVPGRPRGRARGEKQRDYVVDYHFRTPNI